MGSILPFIRKSGAVFDHYATEAMGLAFDTACKELHDKGQPQIVYEIIAKRIIDAAKNGGAQSYRVSSGGACRTGHRNRQVGAIVRGVCELRVGAHPSWRMFRPNVDPANRSTFRVLEVRRDIVQIPGRQISSHQPLAMMAAMTLRAKAVDPDGGTFAPLNGAGQISKELSWFTAPWHRP